MGCYLVTGVSGFIGAKVAEFLLRRGSKVIGVDNHNDYYDQRLKFYRMEKLRSFRDFIFKNIDIEDRHSLDEVFRNESIDAVINLAARAGLRASIDNPSIYFSTNTLGALNLVALMKVYGVNKIVLASTSSLYSGESIPYVETMSVNRPQSPYAASKKAAEELAYTYHYLYGIDVSIVRYFTVFGPAGRPDMCIFRFIKWIDEEKSVVVYGDGGHSRDFTYVDDVARGTVAAIKKVGYEVFNIAGGRDPVTLQEIIRQIERTLGKRAKLVHEEGFKGDFLSSKGDNLKAKKVLGWRPEIDVKEGLDRTIDWHVANREFLRDIKL